MNLNKFQLLNGEIVIVTGGAGLLGREYCEAIRQIGGFPIVLDLKDCRGSVNTDLAVFPAFIKCDITDEEQINKAFTRIRSRFPDTAIYGLINNAALDPKVVGTTLESSETRLEGFPRHVWDSELSVGLTGAFLCTKIFGSEMAKNGRGSIINISSVLGHVAPNQALYRKEGLQDEEQSVKPVTYSVIKHGIIGLTRYTSTYWSSRGVRCNALSPGGVFNGHSDTFVEKLSKYIPMGRMAKKDEYNSAIQFLLTDASSFMTGTVMQIDGGQTAW